MFNLYSKNKKLIGYLCGHCGAIFTPSMNLSEPLRTRGWKTKTAFVPDKRHTEREEAAHELREAAKARLQQQASEAAPEA